MKSILKILAILCLGILGIIKTGVQLLIGIIGIIIVAIFFIIIRAVSYPIEIRSEYKRSHKLPPFFELQ
jgi:hypothetical protein